MSIQIGEQLERRQGRVRALAAVSDRSSEMAVEPVRRIALTQQEASRLLALARCSSWSTSRRTFGWRAGAAGAVPADEMRREVAEYAVCTGRSER